MAKQPDLWKYCTPKQCRQAVLALKLLGHTNWPEDKQLACLYAVSNHTERHYHPVVLEKRDGSKRHLAVPDALLMKIQRSILQNVLNQLPVSAYATAYYPGAKTAVNAGRHVGSPKVLKLDIQDFFHHISYGQVYGYVFSGTYFPPPLRGLLSQLCCYREYLPQGAPTSAAISNLIMRPFDEYIGTWCRERDIRYSRYCDDMTFSGDFEVKPVIKKVSGFLTEMGFTLNSRKTKVISCNCQQLVTGIVVNQKLQVPKDYRRRLRQEIYYSEKYGIASHLSRIGKEAEVKRYWLSLLSRVNYILQINPEDTFFLQARERLYKMKE